jgi:hypothetical protein
MDGVKDCVCGCGDVLGAVDDGDTHEYHVAWQRLRHGPVDLDGDPLLGGEPRVRHEGHQRRGGRQRDEGLDEAVLELVLWACGVWGEWATIHAWFTQVTVWCSTHGAAALGCGATYHSGEHLQSRLRGAGGAGGQAQHAGDGAQLPGRRGEEVARGGDRGNASRCL